MSTALSEMLFATVTHSNTRGSEREHIGCDPFPTTINSNEGHHHYPDITVTNPDSNPAPVLCVPVVSDPSVFPEKPKQYTAAKPFAHPKPVVLTGLRAWVRVIRARGMLIVTDEDLAELYETTVDTINKRVLRNACCFNSQCCFRMSATEWHHIKRQVNVKDVDRGNWLTTPLAFSDGGALALAKLLDTFEATRGSVIVWRSIQNLTPPQGTERE